MARRGLRRCLDWASAASTSGIDTHTAPPTLTDRTRPEAVHARTVAAGKPGTTDDASR